MNWNDLRVLIAIAETGTLAGAASRLRQNHSTVFRRLNQLEADVETRLFDRLPNGYVLTPVGERMLQLARDAETAVQTIDRELTGQDLKPTGTVRLTTAQNIARTIVPAALKQLRQTHPGITVEISVGDSDYDLNRREADLALRATSRPPEHLVGRMVKDLSWWVCGHARHKLLTFEDLSDISFIGAEQSLMRLPSFQWLEANFGHRIVARCNDLSTMAALARERVGLALLPSDQREPGLKWVYEVPHLEGQLWLLTHPDLRSVRRIRAVWDALADAVSSMGNPSN